MAGTFLLKIGFQNLWRKVADKNRLKIRLNSRITKVKRTKDRVRIYVNGRPKDYDFLIWSPELKASLKLFNPLYKDERRAFKSTNADYLTASLVRLKGGKSRDRAAVLKRRG